jgi:Cd2+/Zn2+-exporting ATPase
MGAAGTDVALETADVVLMGDKLDHIPYLIALSKQTRRTLITNIAFSMFMIVLMLLAIFSVQLPLPLAVVGHEGGTVLVSLNGLRLLAYKYHPSVEA